MNKHEIVFYPVANGDTSQVITSNGRRILFDFCHRSCGEDPDAWSHIINNNYK